MTGEDLTELILSKGISREEVAAAIGKSVQTIRRWEKKSPPASMVARIKRALDDEGDDGPGDPMNLLQVNSHRIGTRSKRHITDRHRQCSRLWVFKSFTPFLSGTDNALRLSFLDQLREGETEYFFLFWPNPTGNEDQYIYESKETFQNFKQAVAIRERDSGMDGMFRRVRGFELLSARWSLLFGLSYTYASTVVAEYRQEVFEKNGRRYDIFVEVPVATYQSEPLLSTEDPPLNFDHDVLWLELPQRHTTTLMRLWKVEMDALRYSNDEKRKHSALELIENNAKEVLSDFEEALNFEEERLIINRPMKPSSTEDK